jgi:hypothetical protein
MPAIRSQLGLLRRNRRDSERGATGGTITMKTYRELPDALEAVHEWMLMLADETAIHLSIVTVVERMRENVARRGIGEDAALPSGPDEIMRCDELRRWFEREMGAPYKKVPAGGCRLRSADYAAKRSRCAVPVANALP